MAYYEECGGCDLRHQTMDENLKFKREKVYNALKRIGKIDIEVEKCVPSFKNDNYRNKASFKVENDRIGFYKEATYQLTDIKECLLVENEINDCLKEVRNYIKNNKNKINSITIKYGNARGKLLIDIYSLDEEDIKIVDFLIDRVPYLKTAVFNDKVLYAYC